METHLQTLCRELHRFVEVDVLVSSGERKGNEEEDEGMRVRRIGTLFTFASAPVNPGLARRIRASKADLVHLHLPNPTAVLAYLASGHRGPLVVTYHSDVVRQRYLRKVFEPVLRRLLDRCDAVIVSSPNLIESSPVLREYADRCHIIPFGIPLERFASPDPEVVHAIRERYGRDLIVSVGRLIYYKGFEFLVRSMASAPGHLLIIGTGPLGPELRELARTLGVEERVTFLGEVPDVIPYYHAADIFVLPSIARSEAFGIVQIEAMAAGTPVINTRLNSGVPFVSLDGVSGLTVTPEDSGALAGAIRRLLEDPVLRSRFAAAAHERAHRNFSVQAMVQRTLELYSGLLDATTARNGGRGGRQTAPLIGAAGEVNR
jgi:rhamnosyl/mannosyltransferase